MPAPITHTTLTVDLAPILSGTDPISVTALWYRVEGTLEVLLATGVSYEPVPEDMGFGLFARQRGSNIYGTTEVDSVVSDLVEGAPEYQTRTTLDTLIAGIGDVLTATEGTHLAWPAADPVVWRWLRNGVTIVGATNATYTPVLADVGTALSAESSRTNTRGTGVSVSLETGLVSAAPAFALTQEDGFYLLQEDGSKILL